MQSDWVKIYSSKRLQDVELLKHLLAEKGIEAVTLNQQDSAYISIGDISLLVKRESIIPAKKIITDSRL